MVSVTQKMKDLLPRPIRGFLRVYHNAIKRKLFPVRGKLDVLTRCHPVSPEFGRDRGEPIDRYYIEHFLEEHREDIHGRVLEVADDMYTRRFGGKRVTRCDVLHVSCDAPPVTIVADLTNAPQITSNAFDCVILTQTLQFIYDVRPAVETLFRILRPGGVLLATVPCVAPISAYDQGRWGEYWRFTPDSLYRLLTEHFPIPAVDIRAQGNVFVAASFLYGLSVQELTNEELHYRDPFYPFLITARAMKPQLA